mgnify:CR=1 FL=1
MLCLGDLMIVLDTTIVNVALPSIKAKRAELAKLRKQEKGVSTTLVIEERVTNPRKTTVLIKGDFTRPADVVKPGVPRVLPALKVDKYTAFVALTHDPKIDDPALILVSEYSQHPVTRDFRTLSLFPQTTALDWESPLRAEPAEDCSPEAARRTDSTRALAAEAA